MIQIRRFGSLAAIIVFSMVLAACGLGGDDEEEPTPTNPPEDASLNAEPTATEQPSTPDDPFVLVTSTAEEESSPPDIPDATGPGATIVADEQTPEAATPASTEDSEAGNGEEVPSTPATADPDSTEAAEDDVTPAGEGDDAGETLQATTAPNVGTGSDGTSGPQDVPVEEATPADDSEASPVSNVNAIEVDSCDVVEVPPYAGSGTEFLTTEDVNFRIGPGSDCESVLDGPLGPNVAVEVVGGPVVRTDDPDGTLWVQVIVGEETGWIAQDFLEAVEPE